MAYKTFVLLCLAAGFSAIQAAVIAAAPVAAAVAPAAPVLARIENDAVPQYTFAYDIQDGQTGDSHAQYETRADGIVQGSYSLIEPDNSRRIVDYRADENGFTAVVQREPAIAAVVEPAAPVVAAAAPLLARAAAVAPAPFAPAVARAVAAAPAVAPASPVFARAVAAPLPPRPVYGAPVLARTAVAAPAAVPAPVFARTAAVAAPVAAAAPVYQTYTLPRAVATRLGVPVTYAF